MHGETLFRGIASYGDEDALVWNDKAWSYGWLATAIEEAEKLLVEVEPGSVVALEGDFQPNAVAMFLALLRHSCVIVPLTRPGAE